VFTVTTDGVLTTLVYFDYSNGAHPVAGLVQGSDDYFYGTTEEDAELPFTLDYGTVFKMTAGGDLTTLVSFNRSNGRYPRAGLIQSTNGSFYGTTQQGGANDVGTVFRITTNGALTTLVTFSNSNGTYPWSELTQGSDGSFYGTCYQGGANGYGTVFRMTAAGTLTTLTSFANTNGAYPYAGLVQGSDGAFYGTTSSGGTTPNVNGTVFRITTNGNLNTLVAFKFLETGSEPRGGLLRGSDGSFYGTTSAGGSNGYGTVFRITTNGVFTTLVSFNNDNGAYPYAGLIQENDGSLYGTARLGGAFGYGTVFRVLPVSMTTRRSGSNLILQWPTNAVGFTLQSRTNFSSSATWIDSTSSPVIIGAQFAVTNSISGSTKFYRLRRP
jgi:uncharacterized repeat protein (TIGR03803 family)